ncbi:MAG: sugar transferase [Desulfuromonadales bacterium]|nr:sugar transferase [Desulfuromonadales bacterium]
MLKERAKFFNRLAKLVDLFLVVLALLVAYKIRERWGGLEPIENYLWILVVTIPVGYLQMIRYGFYASLRRRPLFDLNTGLFNVHLIAGIAGAAVIYLVFPDFSRGLYFTFVILSFLLLTTERCLVRLALGTARRQGYNYRNILVVGTGAKALHFKELLDQYQDWGLQILGFVTAGDEPGEGTVAGLPVLGRLEDLVAICKAKPVDEVVFSLPRTPALQQEVERNLREMESLGITVRMVLDLFELPTAKRELEFFHEEIPILTFHSNAFDPQQSFRKRLMDVAGALVGLAAIVVLFPFIALAIRLDSRGPIFFSQVRVGENGRSFRLWKFRSMAVDAEARKQELLARNEMQGAIFKMQDDPRITRVGKFLRRTSLDELPQFWNVLKGEMSLVGTRPPTPEEVIQYETWHRRRISIKPGLTGLWQVSGRNTIQAFDEVVALDLRYIDNWTLWLDVKLIFKTLRVVFRREGS